MNRKLLLVGAMILGAAFSVVCAVAGEAQDQPPGERPRFQVNVDLVSLSLTVFGKDHKLVTDLEESNFIIYEDGVQQKLKVFSQEELPLRMVILLDTSSSMRMKMALAQEAAVRFVGSLKPGDVAQVIEFNDRVFTLVEFTSDLDQVAEAIRSTVAEGATSLYNAIYIALRGLSSRRMSDERQAIVVLSDGADTSSLVLFEDVQELTRKTDVMIYTISLRGTGADLEKQKYYNAKYVLEKLAFESGGSSFAPERIEDLAGVYERIATELKSQYNLGYISTNSAADGSWRRIQVRCTRPGMSVRARAGYYAPRPPPRSRRPQ